MLLEDLEDLQLEVDVARRLRLAVIAHTYCEGGGSWASYGNNNKKPLGRKMDFAVPCCGTVKSRSGSHRPRRAGKEKKRKRKRKGSCLLARAGRSSYLYRLRPMCVNLPTLGVVSTPLQYFASPFVNGLLLRKIRHDSVLCE